MRALMIAPRLNPAPTIPDAVAAEMATVRTGTNQRWRIVVVVPAVSIDHDQRDQHLEHADGSQAAERHQREDQRVLLGVDRRSDQQVETQERGDVGALREEQPQGQTIQPAEHPHGPSPRRMHIDFGHRRRAGRMWTVASVEYGPDRSGVDLSGP